MASGSVASAQLLVLRPSPIQMVTETRVLWIPPVTDFRKPMLSSSWPLDPLFFQVPCAQTLLYMRTHTGLWQQAQTCGPTGG